MDEEVVISVVNCLEESLNLPVRSSVYGHQKHHSGVWPRAEVVRNVLEPFTRVATNRAHIQDLCIVESTSLLQASDVTNQVLAFLS